LALGTGNITSEFYFDKKEKLRKIKPEIVQKALNMKKKNKCFIFIFIFIDKTKG